jgi:hypothetical protein
VLKVTLDHVEPPVWRRIQVPVSASLDDLHVVLQWTMGWEGEHPYDFVAGKRTFSPTMEPMADFPGEEPDEEEMQAQVVEGLKQLAALIEHPEEQPERQAALSALLANMGTPPDLFGNDDEDSGMVEVSEVLKRARSKMTYRYDFGDGWTHTIVVEKANVPTNVEQPAICLDGAGACPPEDCGGPWGYRRIVDAVEHPDDPEYEDEREWLEGWVEGFDPNAFDRVAVNRALSGLTWSLHLAL